jgi:hypothetical protein
MAVTGRKIFSVPHIHLDCGQDGNLMKPVGAGVGLLWDSFAYICTLHLKAKMWT